MTIAENLFLPFPFPLSLIQKILKLQVLKDVRWENFWIFLFLGGGDGGKKGEKGGKRMGRGMFSDVGTVDLKLRRESEGGCLDWASKRVNVFLLERIFSFFFFSSSLQDMGIRVGVPGMDFFF